MNDDDDDDVHDNTLERDEFEIDRKERKKEGREVAFIFFFKRKDK